MQRHLDNVTKMEQMKQLRFYRQYPLREAKVSPSGHFENLVMYYGMAFDKNQDTRPLCSVDAADSLFVISDRTVKELKRRAEKKVVSLKRMQLTAVSYLWELCYDVMLAKSENVSDSPGFEAFDLRCK